MIMDKLKKILIIFLFLVIFSTAAATVSSAEELKFTILHTNDEHSSLIPHSPAVDYEPEINDSEIDRTVGGFARLATAVKNIKREKQAAGEEVLLLSAGDFLGGSPFSWLSFREEAAELKLMQELGYQAAVIGNHEFDYGPEMLADYLREASYPESHEDLTILASNLEADADSLFVQENLYRQKRIIELDNGLKIGLFGVQGENSAALIKDQGNLVFNNSFKTAAAMVAELENEVDIIIALNHSGIRDDLKLAHQLPEIDLIIGGHSHTVLEAPIDTGKTIVAQAGSKLEYLGRLELSYNQEQEELNLNQEESSLIKIDSEIKTDPEFEKKIDQYREKFNQQLAELGTYNQHLETIAESDFVIRSAPPLTETPAGNFITDAMRLQTEEIIEKNVDVAVKTNGSIRKDIVPGKNGEITFYELAETVGLGRGRDNYPGYPIISAYINGRELKELLEVAVLLEEFMGNYSFLQFSGLRYNYDPEAAVLTTLPISNQPVPSLSAVEEAEIYAGPGVQDKDGTEYKKIYDDQLYRIITDSYLLDYLPIMNKSLPQVNIMPKNAEGEVLLPENKEEFKVYKAEDRELKIWETVVNFAAEQKVNKEGTAEIPDYYREKAGRINQVKINQNKKFGLSGGSLHSFLREDAALNSQLSLDQMEGYYFGADLKLDELKTLALNYNYLSTQDSTDESREKMELSGLELDYSYRFSRILEAAGFTPYFDWSLLVAAGLYSGNYYLNQDEYYFENDLALKLGISLEKDLSSSFSFKGNLNYKNLKSDFEDDSSGEELNRDLAAINLELGLTYIF